MLEIGGAPELRPDVLAVIVTIAGGSVTTCVEDGCGVVVGLGRGVVVVVVVGVGVVVVVGDVVVPRSMVGGVDVDVVLGGGEGVVVVVVVVVGGDGDGFVETKNERRDGQKSIDRINR